MQPSLCFSSGSKCANTCNDIILNKRKSIFMFSRVISFFDRPKPKKTKKFHNSGKRKNYAKKSMEWQDDEDDRRSSIIILKTLSIVLPSLFLLYPMNFLVDSLSWVGRNALEKSKSDSSIIAIGDSNYRTQGTQVSLETFNAQRIVTSALENLNLGNDDDDDTDENETNFIPVINKDCRAYNQFDYNLLCYGFKTQDITTKQLVTQRPEILDFQGNKHSPEEIAFYWKKDCRTWLWKSVRLANRLNQMETPVISVME